MQAKLEAVEIETVVDDDDDFGIENAARRQRGAQRIEQFGEVTVQGLCIAALDIDFIAIAEDEGAETIPLGLEDPTVAFRQIVDAFREHGQDRRVDGEIHLFIVQKTAQKAVPCTVCFVIP